MLIAPLGATYCINKIQNQYVLYYKLRMTYDAIETRSQSIARKINLKFFSFSFENERLASLQEILKTINF